MLRMMFGEPPRKLEGRLGETIHLIRRFVSLMQKRIKENPQQEHSLRKYEIWTLGLLASLDELEESQYASHRFAGQIKTTSMAEMTEEDLLSYYRHVYFDKNAFIRVFSLLDKLGTLMNDMFQLRTERVKPHFSYFTVLRNMREKNLHPPLSKTLNELKERYKEPLSRLRKRRNTEIHYMNPEMQDDLRRLDSMNSQEAELENISGQLNDLDRGCEMVMESLYHTFDYAYAKFR
ncbi:Cthe_2314 family HEPN domain-containing protein [Paenibacillus pinihumi]|uniref:Cthe_2314 family HEPN domain-containing protein n=1 Tax=Paenibacillus pinihumi TaxID=669462 RepID=UPI0004134783|nr:Cthe_2314 family HEPN domain-containing protein [Paenibacillus pinihumi]